MARAEGSGAVPAAFETGSYVRIEGLQRGTEHNGRFGFVVGRPRDDSERFSVVVAHHDVLLNVKPDNLVLERQDRTSRRHEVVMVYPNAKSRVREPKRCSSRLVSRPHCEVGPQTTQWRRDGCARSWAGEIPSASPG